MNLVTGVIRVLIAGGLIGVGTLPVLLGSLVPLRLRGAKLGAWAVTLLARFLLRVFDVQLDPGEHRKKIIRHRGLIFPNHVSFLDTFAFMALAPVRFLGKMEIRSWPFVGWIASSIDTVWVERGSKESRSQAREALLDVPRYPPIVLFPEGGILVTGETLNPFRWGAFEIAIQSKIPYLPCVLVYDQREMVFWGDESLMEAVWRVASRRSGTIHLKVVALHAVAPALDEEAPLLAAEAHGAILSVLEYYRGEEQVVEEGI